MFHKNRSAQFLHYNNARHYFLSHPERIVQLEKYLSDEIEQLLTDNLDEVVTDYNEASYIFPFWQNYPPRERGRKPIGDQFPWIEVGEHVVGRKLARWLPRTFRVRDTGSPTGPDERFLLSSPEVKEILEITDSTWLFLDIKSVGPRDDADHAVWSHNQVSGSGTWTVEEEGVRNGILT